MRTLEIKFFLDLILWLVAVPIALWLRLETIPSIYLAGMFWYLIFGIPLKAFWLWFFALYRQYFSAAGVRDLLAIGKCVVVVVMASFCLVYILRYFYPFPRSIPLIEGLLAFVLLGGIRVGVRILRERIVWKTVKQAKRILVVGAGEAGILIVREMFRHPEANLVPIGFLDDDPAKLHQRFVGLPVLGKVEKLSWIARKNRADEVLIAIPSAPGRVIRRIYDLAQEAKIPCRVIPGIYEILSGKVTIRNIRDVNLEDLLRREPIRLNLQEIGAYLKGKIVLVTGAGGSIGQEIVKQLIGFSPQEVILFGRGENSLFEIETELKLEWPHFRCQVIVGDIRDKNRLEHVFEKYKPQVVFHAAAHKHVPLMELNPSEAVFNNVLGTKHLVELSLEKGVERFVNISTDKAVNPTSVMGATKRVAEYIVQWASRHAKPNQVFVSVRFGNVLGSRGSVVPLFQKLIARRKPLPVTHPEMKRYFMTPTEAAQLVLQAGGFSENGVVYVLDMGEPVKIVDLARELIRLSGLEPERDIPIEYAGIRPGEKLFEEILSAEEGTRASRHEKIFIARNSMPSEENLLEGISCLLQAAKEENEENIRQILQKLVPTYAPVPKKMDFE
ncbi:MAG: polysaccharide biosynthesis protein [Candidatus Caldatribacteriaceae bacterium]